MYLAELHGKVSSSLERMEDVLTSNVFSFFKYSNRKFFLKPYLATLGFEVSDKEADAAEFEFWRRLSDNTEPDLVIKVGKYYLLVEAKYFSEFDEGPTKDQAQIVREIQSGRSEAQSYGLEFHLVAITADHYYKGNKFRSLSEEDHSAFKWTNWQAVCSFLESTLESSHKLPTQYIVFANDLHNLLVKKNLRGFRGTEVFETRKWRFSCFDQVFFRAETANFRGDFVGFVASLSSLEDMLPLGDSIFWA